MFVFEWWRAMYTSSLEMAARSALSAFSLPAPQDATHTEARALPAPLGDEDLLSSLAEITFCTLDRKGEAKAFSANWQALTKLESSRCGGVHFVDYFHPQHRQLLFRKIKELHDGEAATLRFRAQYGSTHVGYRWYEFTLAQRDALVAVVMRDISREMETERILRTAQIETELALRARAEFLGHMSHEMRTPLNAVLGFAEMMEIGVHGEVEIPEYRDYLANIRESGQMLLGRINDMLEIASIEIGDTEIHDTQLSPETILEGMMQLHRHEAFCRRVTLKSAGMYPLVVIRCDQAKLTRALGNILANAIRFSKQKSEVSAYCTLTQQGGVAFTVRDKGEGISVDHLTQLQDALDRKSSMFSSSPEKVCLGLGLAVAKEFTCLHGGQLYIDSEKGKGTEVTLILPPERVISLEPPRRRKQQLASAKQTA